MPKDKNIINETIDYLPLIGAGLGAGLGAIDGLSWTNPLPVNNMAIGAVAGGVIGYQVKKTIKNKDENKTKIGTSLTCGIGFGLLNATLNPEATAMNTLQAGAGGIIAGKAGKIIVAKGTQCIKSTPQYQAIKHANNANQKLKKAKNFCSKIKEEANLLDLQKKSSTNQKKINNKLY